MYKLALLRKFSFCIKTFLYVKNNVKGGVT
jgi:hypothetical protein